MNVKRSSIARFSKDFSTSTTAIGILHPFHFPRVPFSLGTFSQTSKRFSYSIFFFLQNAFRSERQIFLELLLHLRVFRNFKVKIKSVL